MNHKLFILVDKNLSRSQQTVQCGHALLNFSYDWSSEDWHKMSLVILAVNGEEELRLWSDKLTHCNKSDFLEPYWDHRMTAVVAFGETVEDQVKELRLL